MALILKGGRVVDPANNLDVVGDVRLDGGKVVSVGETVMPGDGEQVLDCSGKVVCPGLIDIHVHLRVPGQEYKEDLDSGLRAAAAGGFTAVACMPNTQPFIDNASIVRDLYVQAAQVKGARLSVIAAISKGMKNVELSEMADMKEAGAIAVSDDAFQVQDTAFMRRAMEYAKMLDLPVLAHCEDIALSDGGGMNEGLTASVMGIKGLPREAYEMHVMRNGLLSLMTGAHLHVLHVSTAREVEIIRFLKAQGANVTAETGPHYFAITDEACRGYNTNAKMNPPLRTQADADAMLVGLADGTLDCIATDHAPHAEYEKQQEFMSAPFGIVGLETSLALCVMYIKDIPQIVRQMSTEPARILKMPGGNLSVGSVADVTVFDPAATWTVDPNLFVSKGRNTPFAGWKMTGKATYTIVGGEVVFGN